LIKTSIFPQICKMRIDQFCKDLAQTPLRGRAEAILGDGVWPKDSPVGASSAAANIGDKQQIDEALQKLQGSINRPDTEALDQPSPTHHFRLATHGRSIQKGHV
jgi:hypothetical protein